MYFDRWVFCTGDFTPVLFYHRVFWTYPGTSAELLRQKPNLSLNYLNLAVEHIKKVEDDIN